MKIIRGLLLVLLSISIIVFVFMVFIIGFYVVINGKEIDYTILLILFRILLGAGLTGLLTLIIMLLLSEI